jgi:hypothetical protein
VTDLPISKDPKKLTFIGAGVLALGTFMPIVSVPIIGSISYFQGGDGKILLVVAIVAAVLAYLNQTKHVLWAGIAAALVLFYGLFNFMKMKSDMQAELGADENNPFRGLAEMAMQSVQIQWGWIPLLAGTAALLYAGWIAFKAAKDGAADQTDAAEISD